MENSLSKKPRRYLESDIQKACVEWFNWKHYRLFGLLFSVPNGGRRGMTEAKILKAEGVVKGVSDLILFVPNKDYHALCIEMKANKGTQSDSQVEWQKKVEKQGYKYIVCKSLDSFIKEVNSYLNGID